MAGKIILSFSSFISDLSRPGIGQSTRMLRCSTSWGLFNACFVRDGDHRVQPSSS